MVTNLPTMKAEDFQRFLEGLSSEVRSKIEQQIKDQMELEKQHAGVIERTGREIEEKAKKVEELRKRLSELGLTLREGIKISEEEREVLEKLGITVKKVTEEEVEEVKKRFSSLMGFVSRIEQEVPKALRSVLERMKSELRSMGEEAESLKERISSGAGSFIRSVNSVVQSEIGRLVPPALAKWGIWGLLIGMVIGAGERFEAESAIILTSWQNSVRRIAGGAGDVATSVEKMQRAFTVFRSEWLNVMSQEEMVEVWQRSAGVVDQYGKTIDGAVGKVRRVIDATLDLDMLMGVRFGTTIDRVSTLLVEYGKNVDKSISEMRGLRRIFEDNVGPTNVWLQAVMDLQSRLGVVGLNMRNVAGVLNMMGEASQRAGGGLAQARGATEEIIGMFGRVEMPFQAMMGMAAFPGGNILQQMMKYQQLVQFGKAGGVEFGEAMPRMLAALFERFGLFDESLSREERWARLRAVSKQLGYSEKTTLLMANLLQETKDPKKFIAEFKKSRDLQRQIHSDTADLREMMRKHIPDYARALNAIKDLLLGIIGLIGDGIAAIVAIIYAFATDRPMDQVLAAIATRLDQRKSSIEAAGRELGRAAIGLIPGVGLMQQVKEMTPEKSSFFGGLGDFARDFFTPGEVGIPGSAGLSGEEPGVLPGSVSDTSAVRTGGAGGAGGGKSPSDTELLAVELLKATASSPGAGMDVKGSFTFHVSDLFFRGIFGGH